MKKLQMRTIALLATVWFAFANANAQVTIGAQSPPNTFSVLELVSTQGGLRLPQMDTVQRNALTSSLGITAADGLVIFNINSNCVEYWKQNQWISLCEGASRMNIWPEPHKTKIDADGNMTYIPYSPPNDTIEYSMADDPDAPNGPFTFSVMLGNEYASIGAVDEIYDGLFEIAFQSNTSTHTRNAIVRITNVSNGKYIDALYTQEGMDCATMNAGPAPNIETVPASAIGAGRTIAFCGGGAVYLYADTTTNGFIQANLDQLIWTRNGIEIARGVTNIAVTQAGVYDVSMGLIGCNAKAGNAVNITRNGNSSAAGGVTILVTGNNGTVCDESGMAPYGTVQLTARQVSGAGGTVRWFKNGKLQPVQGKVIQASIGTWFAVVSEGNDPNACYSTPSEKIQVSLDPNAGSNLTPPTMDLGTGDFCAGSTKTFSVTNIEAGVTYVWYANNEQIGVGEKIQYVIPKSATQQIIIRCRATKPGSCAAEASNDKAISTGAIPAMPTIAGDKVLCSGEATLSILPAAPGTYIYAWYKDGELKASTQLYKITEGGDYYATVTPATGTPPTLTPSGCTSPMAHIDIPKASSALPVVSLNASSTKTDEVIVGSKLTFTASLLPGTATDFKWTITDATIKSGGQAGDVYAVVEFPTHSVTATVSVEGFNACGSAEAKMSIAVKNDCEQIDKVLPKGETALSVVKGFPSTLEVAATFSGGNTAPRTYQWYSNTTSSNTGGNLIAGETNSKFIAPNDVFSPTPYYYYCVVSGAGSCSNTVSMASPVFSVTVNNLPAPGSDATYGTFVGRTCFDIDFSSNGTCGTISSRQNIRADFNIRTPQDIQSGTVKAPYSGVQIYTFTPAKGKSVNNVRFAFVDQSNLAIENIVPVNDYSGNNISAPCKVTVNFKPTLQTYLQGKSMTDGLHPELYVIYYDAGTGGTERSLKLTMNLQDCSCCGARTMSGGWLTFMCHNLGADENLDPFSFIEGNPDGTGGTLGYLYQWGRSDDGLGKGGYQRRNSSATSSLAGEGAYPNPTNPGHNMFIVNGKEAQGQDWTTGGDRNSAKHNDRWGNGSQDENVPKAKNDPCPEGWKVPSQKQWASIFDTYEATPSISKVNSWVWTGKGYMVGDGLYLPAAGYHDHRYDKGGQNVGIIGNYWSSTVVPGTRFAYPFRFEVKFIEPLRKTTARANGFSVRCVLE